MLAPGGSTGPVLVTLSLHEADVIYFCLLFGVAFYNLISFLSIVT